jgi:hypothetical protein
MKMIKMALLGGAAMAVTAASAQADDLEALKAQIDALNTRVAAMETAPSVPTGYQLIAISEGELQGTPGLGFTAQERAAYGNKGTVISVLPTADAPAGTTITWSGYVRTGLVFSSVDGSADYETYNTSADPDRWESNDAAEFNNDDDFDVKSRGQLRVKASTDTAVGEVGVDIRLRANFDEIGKNGSVYSDVAWGYWAMTPELTFGGGYAGSLGNIGYGWDGACNCYLTDTIGFNPGDASQLRLSYGSGPFSMAIAVEDASIDLGKYKDKNGFDTNPTGDRLGVAGEVKYSGDIVSGEISGMWRDIDDIDDEVPANFRAAEAIPDAWWQIGAGMSFGLGDIATLSLAAAMGEGPVENYSTNSIDGVGIFDDFSLAWNNSWWGATALMSFGLSDEVSAEIMGGYLSRDFDDVDLNSGTEEDVLSAESDRWGAAAGIYYTPVDQLTVGLEASYTDTTADVDYDNDNNGAGSGDQRLELNAEQLIVDMVAVWRF